MSTQQKILLIILAVCGGLFFFSPPSGYQAEIAGRKKMAVAESNEKLKELEQQAKKAMADRKKSAENAVRAAAELQLAQAKEAADRAAKEKMDAERMRAERVAASEAAARNSVAMSSNLGSQRNVAAIPPNQLNQQVRQQIQQQAQAQKNGMTASLKTPVSQSAPTVIVTRTTYATRFLYLRLKGRVLRFDVVKEMSESELDSLVKVLANVCVTTDKLNAKCRTNLIIDRSFYSAANQLGDESSTSGWNLECHGALADCLSSASKSVRFSLSENLQAGTKMLARGFVGQAIGSKAQAKLSASTPIVIDKVYVTRMAAR